MHFIPLGQCWSGLLSHWERGACLLVNFTYFVFIKCLLDEWTNERMRLMSHTWLPLTYCGTCWAWVFSSKVNRVTGALLSTSGWISSVIWRKDLSPLLTRAAKHRSTGVGRDAVPSLLSGEVTGLTGNSLQFHLLLQSFPDLLVSLRTRNSPAHSCKLWCSSFLQLSPQNFWNLLFTFIPSPIIHESALEVPD